MVLAYLFHSPPALARRVKVGAMQDELPAAAKAAYDAITEYAPQSQPDHKPERIDAEHPIHVAICRLEKLLPGNKLPPEARPIWRRLLKASRANDPLAFDEADELAEWLQATWAAASGHAPATSDAAARRRIQNARQRIQNARDAMDAAEQEWKQADAEYNVKLCERGIDQRSCHWLNDTKENRTIFAPQLRNSGQTVIFTNDPDYQPVRRTDLALRHAEAEYQAALRARLPDGWEGEFDAPDFISLADIEPWLARKLKFFRDLKDGLSAGAANSLAAIDLRNFFRILDHLCISDRPPRPPLPPADVHQVEAALSDLLAWVRQRLAAERGPLIAEFERGLESQRNQTPIITDDAREAVRRRQSAADAQRALERYAEEQLRSDLLAAGFTDADFRGEYNHVREIRGDDPRAPAFHKAMLEYDRRIKAIAPTLQKLFAPPPPEPDELTSEAANAPAIVKSTRAAEVPDQMVTLLQMASSVNRTKSAIEKIKAKLPAPQVKGGKGKPNEWRWALVRPILAEHFSRPDLPEIWPADRFRRR